MKTRSTLLLSAFAAALVLAAAVGTAGAATLSTSNQTFRVVYSPLVLSGFTSEVRCNVTLEGSYSNTTIAKVEGSQVGSITAARVSRPCTGGEAWVYNGTEVLGTTTLATSLPWRILYTNFEGTLPNITGINTRLVGSRFLVESTFLGFRVRCVYTTTEAEPATGRIVRNTTTGVAGELVAGGTIRTTSSGCPTGRFSGSGSITLQGNTTLITVTLI